MTSAGFKDTPQFKIVNDDGTQTDLAGVANFGGKKAPPFAKGGGRKKKLAAAKAAAAKMRNGVTADNSVLSTKKRKSLPSSTFAGPGRSYPIPDKSHAANAKARASQAYAAGRISKAQRDKIHAAANRKLGSSGKA